MSYILKNTLDVGVTNPLSLNLPPIPELPDEFKDIYNQLTNLFPNTSKDIILTRSGTIADGACFFHSIYHSLHGKQYTKLSENSKKKVIYKLRQKIADSLSIKKWMTIGNMETAYLPIFQLLRTNFQNVYNYIKNPGSEIKKNGLKRILQQTYFKSCLPYYQLCYEILPFLQLNDDLFELKQKKIFNEFVEKVPEFNSRIHIRKYKVYDTITNRLYISDGKKWTPKDGLLYNVLAVGDDYCRKQERESAKNKVPYLLHNCLDIHKQLIKEVFESNLNYKATSLEETKKDFYISKYNELIDSIFEISIQESYEKYKKSISQPYTWVGNELIELVSNYLDINIFIISNESKIYKWSFGNPYYDDRDSVIIAWINESHYESVAFTYPDKTVRRAKRKFNKDHPIVKFFKYLYMNLETIDKLYLNDDEDEELKKALKLSQQHSNEEDSEEESEEDSNGEEESGEEESEEDN